MLELIFFLKFPFGLKDGEIHRKFKDSSNKEQYKYGYLFHDFIPIWLLELGYMDPRTNPLHRRITHGIVYGHEIKVHNNWSQGLQMLKSLDFKEEIHWNCKLWLYTQVMVGIVHVKKDRIPKIYCAFWIIIFMKPFLVFLKTCCRQWHQDFINHAKVLHYHDKVKTNVEQFSFFLRTIDFGFLCLYVRIGLVLDFFLKLVFKRTNPIFNIFIYIL